MEKFFGVSLSLEELMRITHCVGFMALSVLMDAKDMNEVKESKALYDIHGKLVDALNDALRMVEEEKSDEA